MICTGPQEETSTWFKDNNKHVYLRKSSVGVSKGHGVSVWFF